MKPALLVIGPSRSGSSALTAVLGMLGATLPATLLEAGPGNERGHFESRPLMALNDEVLRSHGGNYWDPAPIPPGWFGSAEAAGFVERIAATFAAEYGDADLPVLKDPRLCRLAPLTLAALGRLGRRPLAIVPLRHPAEGAGSLSARDGTAAETAELLQVRELLGAEAVTRGLPRALSSYGELLADWRGLTARLAERLGITWPVVAATAAAEVEAFLAPGLRHVAGGAGGGALARRLWAAFEAGLGGDEARLRAECDAVAAVIDEVDRLSAPWLRSLRDRAAVSAAEATAWREAAEARAALLAAREAELAGVRASASWRLTAPLRTLGRLLRR